MAIDYEILGVPGRDNALLVTVDSGQSLHRLLFDCGEGCLANVRIAHIQDIEAVFFSHFHIDHIAGFDSLLRMNWCRPQEPVRVFGPPGAIEILHHRLRGFTWNLVQGIPGEWLVTEIDEESSRTARFLTAEGFATEHAAACEGDATSLYGRDEFTVTSCLMSHGIPCLAYKVEEKEHWNIDTGPFQDLGLEPGPWLQAVKNPQVSADDQVTVAGRAYRVGQLRDRLLVTRPGSSIAYLTDFFLESTEFEDRIVAFLTGCQVLICENNYRDHDAELAAKNYHMTSSDVARLANRVKPEQLILFHLSDRYTHQEWRDQLGEVRRQFARTSFPEQWAMENGPIDS